ncbi:putative photosynthetic complex assembly protein PuhE [Alsobacter sp. R-9]
MQAWWHSWGAAIGFALFVWWFSTGVILMLVRIPRVLHPIAMAGFTVLAAACLWGLAATRSDVSPLGAFAGFTYGIVIWGWLETAFLFGYVTGPRRVPLREPVSGLERFRQAWGTIAYHELSILAAGIGLVVLTFGAPNQVGTWTFLVLWIMRISAKLNLFFGAPNVSAELLPPHLDYLGSYFARRRVGAFFPFSVTVASLCFGVALHAAATAVDGYGTVSWTLIASLLGLAIIEHWFLVLPLPDAALWRWAVKSPEAARIAHDFARDVADDLAPFDPMNGDAVRPVAVRTPPLTQRMP